MPRLRHAVLALTLLLVFCCALALYHALSAIPLRFSLDPNEGWNAYHALAARTGAPPYPPADSLFVNNYPPLSFYVVGALGSLLGDDIVAGRLISLLALVALLAGVFFALRRMRCRNSFSAFATLFLLSAFLAFSDYVAMNDPQMLGQAIGMAGLLFALHAPVRRDAVIAAALCCALAFFIKHNLVVLPIALALWLWRRAPGCLAYFVGVYGAALLSGLLACRVFLQIDLLTVLGNPRLYDFALLLHNLGNWLIFGVVPLAVLMRLVWRRYRDPHVLLVTLYAAIGIEAGIFFFGGAGVDMNAMFDADIALALAIGLALERLRRPRGLALLLMLPLGIGVIRNFEPAWFTGAFWTHPHADEARLAASDIAFLKRRPGPALCENLALCYWAGKPAGVDVFNIGEAYLTHARSDDFLVALLQAQHFRTVEFDTLSSSPLGERVLVMLERRYIVDHQNDEGVFLVPR